MTTTTAQRELRTPLDTAGAKRVGDRVYRKQVLPIGEYTVGGRTLKFTPDYLQDVAEAFSDQAFDTVPLVLADATNNHTMAAEAGKYGEVVGMEFDPHAVNPDNGKPAPGLYSTVKLSAEAADIVERNPKFGVSVRLKEGYTRPDGKHYRAACQHVLGTWDCRITGMTPWAAIDLSHPADDGGTVVDLSALTYESEEAAMADDPTTTATPEAIPATPPAWFTQLLESGAITVNTNPGTVDTVDHAGEDHTLDTPGDGDGLELFDDDVTAETDAALDDAGDTGDVDEQRPETDEDGEGAGDTADDPAGDDPAATGDVDEGDPADGTDLYGVDVSELGGDPADSDSGGEGAISDAEWDAITAQALAATGSEQRELVSAANPLTGSVELAHNTGDGRVIELAAQVQELTRDRDRARYEQERTELAQSTGLPPHLIDLAAPLLTGTNTVELSNSDTVDAGEVVRKLLKGVGDMVRLLDLSHPVGVADPPPAAEDEVAERRSKAAMFITQTGLSSVGS